MGARILVQTKLQSLNLGRICQQPIASGYPTNQLIPTSKLVEWDS